MSFSASPLIPDQRTGDSGGDWDALPLPAKRNAAAGVIESIVLMPFPRGASKRDSVAGDRVVITEDTTSRGVTLADAIDVVREFGAEPVLVLALVDRGGTAAGYAEAAGVPFVALVTAPDLGFPYDSAVSEA